MVADRYSQLVRKMSAIEEDTELRDLLIQNLENNGVLNKLKAEVRAAVFLAMEEQDKVENKTPLVNENLKKCLNTIDGRLVASLINDFLQVFNLDFTLAVFQPEINSLNCLDSRDQVCKELGLAESEVNKNTPLLLDCIKRGRNKEQSAVPAEELPLKHIANARKKFDVYDMDRIGSIGIEDLKRVFADLFPDFNKKMLEKFVTDELRAVDKSFSKLFDFQVFLGLYKRLYAQCRSVVIQDSGDLGLPPNCFIDNKISNKNAESNRSDGSLNFVGKGDISQRSRHSEVSDNQNTPADVKKVLDLDLGVEEDPDEGDSFFDDPLPKPQKTYGWKMEAPGASDNPAGSRSEAVQRPGGAGITSEGPIRNGAAIEKGFKDLKATKDKSESLHLDEEEYYDDFNSHRSDFSRSALSIGEEIEEVSIEGPENSDKFDETTQDLSLSQFSQSHGADYMEDVA
ncbi:centrosomal protein 43 isoform X2 [Genypterus blacodes]|uniref:centrosomal protein 43 isoform X2 n=1 Tax=Genypterus blacodes TaxID=154954 RepID=UPI003F76F1A2